MFAKILMVIAIVLVSTQALPAPKPRELSKIFAPRAARTLYDDVAKAIDECRNTTTHLLIENTKVAEITNMFVLNTNKLQEYFVNLVETEFYKHNATCTEYFDKAEEQGVDIKICYDEWWNTNAESVQLVEQTINNVVVKFAEDHMMVWYYQSGDLIMARNQLELLDLEAWACENDECLEGVHVRVKEQTEYVIGYLAPRIGESIEEVTTSGGLLSMSLYGLVDNLAGVMGSITDDFVKCAEDILG